jgi:hypothetical protein
MVAIALALKDIDLDQVVFVQYPAFEADNGLYPSEADAEILEFALANDKPIRLTGTTGLGSQLDPNAPPVPPETTGGPSSSATADSEPPAVELPEAIPGQTAGQYTCSDGRTLGEQ